MTEIKSAKIFLTVFLSLACFLPAAAVDFDKDGKADFAVFRPSSGIWYSQSEDKSAFFAVRWGLASDVLVPGDYDGDAVTDIAVWRPSDGTWYIQRSSDNQNFFVTWGMTTQHPTGGLPDVPVPADYDGDKRTDIAIWRPDTGEWFVLKSSEDFNQTKPIVFSWGRLGDIPVQADYDGDKHTDFAVFRSWENRWYIFESGSRSWRTERFGTAGTDRLVPADYTGDGKADIAVYRRGTWLVMNSESRDIEPFFFGFHDDMPAPADYDGDGTTDFGVYRRGVWYIYDSATPRFRSFTFGNENDIPLNSLGTKPSIVAIP